MAEENTGAAGTTNNAATDAGANTSLAPGTTEPKGEGQNKEGEIKQDTSKENTAPVIPEKYELKLPEGVLIDEGMMKEFTAFGKDMKWTNEIAQKAADLHLKAISAFASKQDAEFETRVQDWSKELQNDKDIGGAKIDESMKQARRTWAMAKDIPGVNMERLTKDMQISGMITHPDIVRIFHYFGQFVGEDNKFIRGGNTSDGGEKDAATILYGPTGVKESK